MNKLIINLAPTGMIPTKKMTPHIPISPQEIVEDSLACAELGASIVHIHARGPDGLPTFQKEIFAQSIAGLRKERPELIIVASTSGRNYPEFLKRSEVLDLEGDAKPDMASLTLSSLNFIETASINSPETVIKLAEKMKEKGIKPELEVFDLGMINFAKYLIKKDLLDPPYYFNVFLGNIASAQATLMHAAIIAAELPQPCFYSLAGLGQFQKTATALGVISADGVRVGLEDNIWLNKKQNQMTSNTNLVTQVVKLAEVLERPIATPQDVRGLLKIRKVKI